MLAALCRSRFSHLLASPLGPHSRRQQHAFAVAAPVVSRSSAKPRRHAQTAAGRPSSTAFLHHTNVAGKVSSGEKRVKKKFHKPKVSESAKLAAIKARQLVEAVMAEKQTEVESTLQDLIAPKQSRQFVHYTVALEQQDLIAGLKAPNVGGLQLDELIKRDRGEDWEVAYAQTLVKGSQDVFIAVRGKEVLESLREVARARKINKVSLWMVHGKVDEEVVDLLKRSHKNSTDAIHDVRVIETYRSHSAQNGWLSLLEARWCAVQQAAIKPTLQKIGYPLVGHGKNTLKLRARGFRGNKMAACGLELPLPDRPMVQFTKLEDTLQRYKQLGEREQAAWDIKTRKREVDLIAQGVEAKRARILAEERDPISYETGHEKFGDLSFSISPKVFAPFPGSLSVVESLAEAIADDTASERQSHSEEISQGLTLLPAGPPVTSMPSTKAVLDLGVGSGCLLLTFLKNYCKGDSGWKGYGVDISPDAVEVTLENAKALGLAQQCSFKVCDYAQVPDPFSNGETSTGAPKFSAVLCNPPYLPDHVADSMRTFASLPRAGYCGGEDGLNGYRSVASFFAQTKSVAPGALVAVETSGNFAKRHDQVKSLLCESGHLSFLRMGKPDHTKTQRCLIFRYTGMPPLSNEPPAPLDSLK